MGADFVKVFLPFTVSFTVGILLAPILSHYLYKLKMWKKKSVALSIDGKPATISSSLHNDEEKKTPRMGGVLIWASASITALLFWVFSNGDINTFFEKMDFISRSQTWIPLFAIVFGGIIGLFDDYLGTREIARGGYIGGGLALSVRLGAVALMGLFCGYWFYSKLGISTIGTGFPLFPTEGLHIGALIIPLFIIIILAIYSGGVIDGIDGLSGGIFAAMFASYAGIAFYQNQIDLAAFCASVVGGILAFLWFNIPPARFYMSETGIMALTMALTIVAFMTDSMGDGYGLLVLPIIAIPLIVTTASVITQLLSKKFLGRKIFLVAPIHHHFQALGWPSYKVTMRFWIVGVVFAILGMVIAIAG